MLNRLLQARGLYSAAWAAGDRGGGQLLTLGGQEGISVDTPFAQRPEGSEVGGGQITGG